MHKQSHINSENTDEEQLPLDAEDLAKLFNYPAIGEIFSAGDTRRLDEMCARLNATRENLERIVRHGDRSASESATRAIRGIEITLEFLQNLQNLRASQNK